MNSAGKLISYFVFYMASAFSVLHADADPALTITTKSGISVLTRSQLLRDFNVEHIAMHDSRAYPGIKMDYTAVKLCDILNQYQVDPAETIELISSDEFAALVPAADLLHCTDKTAIAYLGVEPAQHPWPRLKYNNADQHNPETKSAGPFQVIWVHPEKSYISNEYWAWKVVGINVYRDLDKKTYLQAPLTQNSHVQNGYHAYVSRCSGCHTINHIGKGRIGPDLNKPVSAVEKFHDELLKKFIRDPQSVRAKRNDRMSGTSEQFLSKRDLDDLVQYLHYMANRTGG